jgi:inner membrane protein involved in colicin E2 resistance
MEGGLSITERKICSLRILYQVNLSFKTEGEIKTFQDKQKLKQHVTTKPPQQKILVGILHTEDENKCYFISHERMEILKLKGRPDKYSESRTHKPLHKSNKKQMAGITTYLVKLTLNVSGFNSHTKRYQLANWIKK